MVQTSWQLPAAGSAWNEPATISTTKECTTVEERVTETNSKAKVRGLKSYYLSDIHLRPGTAWNWPSTDRLDNEGIYLYRGPSYGEKFQGGCETIDSSPPISLMHIWIQESSENRTEVVPSAAQYFIFFMATLLLEILSTQLQIWSRRSSLYSLPQQTPL